MIVHCPNCKCELKLSATPSKLAPCENCNRPLTQRQRMRKCPSCGHNNWKAAEADRKARKAAKEALLDPRIGTQ